LIPLFFILLTCIRQLDFQKLENPSQASDFDTKLGVSSIFGEKGVSMSRTSCELGILWVARGRKIGTGALSPIAGLNQFWELQKSAHSREKAFDLTSSTFPLKMSFTNPLGESNALQNVLWAKAESCHLKQRL
jgi:hypothetical protein